jgi:hypothetical protein
MAELRKYGAEATIYFPLVDAGAVDFEATPVSFAAGDTQISKDGGAFANTSNNPAHEGNGIYSLVLTSTEMQAAVVVVTVVDSATKSWEDQAIIIDTYGNASAQHAIDLDSTFLTAAQVNTEVDTALADYDAPTKAELDSGLAGLNDLSAADVNAEVDTALADYDGPTNAEMEARTLPAADYFDPAADTVATVTTVTALADILNVHFMVPPNVDLADTVSYRLGILLANAVDNIPTTAEITPGTIDIERKAIGGTSWTSIVNAGACSEQDGLIYYDEVFNAGTGYAEGDTLRFVFKGQKITVGGNDIEITSSNGVNIYSEIRQTMRGTNSAALAATALSTATWTSGRAGYIDNLNIGEDVAGVSDISGLNDLSAAQVNAEMDTALADYDPPTKAEMDTAFTEIKGGTFSDATDSLEAIRDRGDAAWVTGAGGSAPTVAEIRTEMDSNSTQLAAIVADTNELQGDWANGGRLDLILDELTTQGDTNEGKLDTIDTVADAVLVDTGTTIPAQISGLNNLSAAQVNAEVDTALADYDPPTKAELDSGLAALNDVTVADILTTQMTESYSADGAAPTLAQALFLIQQQLGDFAISGTTLTVKKIDGSTTAATFTLNDATTPTAVTRAT